MNSPLILRSSPSNYAVLGIILGPIFLGYVALTFVSLNMWPGLLASGALLAAVLGWIASIRLVVTNDRIMYSDWLRSREMALLDIKNVRIATGLAFDEKHHLLPFRRLVLEPRGNKTQQTVFMNLATFSPHDIKALVSRLDAAKT
jgi:hypothetical protein